MTCRQDLRERQSDPRQCCGRVPSLGPRSAGGLLMYRQDLRERLWVFCVVKGGEPPTWWLEALDLIDVRR